MALYREAFFNMRQPDGSFKEITLSNFGYEVLEDFKQVDTNRNYWFTTIDKPANRPNTGAWNFVGFVMNYQHPKDGRKFTKIIAFELGANSPNFFIRGLMEPSDWGPWYAFRPSAYQNLAGDEIPFTENTPVTIPEL